MKSLRWLAMAAASVALLAGTMIVPQNSVSAQGGNNQGGPGCVQTAQGSGPGGEASALMGGNRSDSDATLVNVIGLIVANADALNDVADVVAAINALNSNNINAQVLCLNNVLNSNDMRLLQDVLNNNNVLNGSPILSDNAVLNDALNNALQNAQISALNNVQVVAVNLGGTPQIYILRR